MTFVDKILGKFEFLCGVRYNRGNLTIRGEVNWEKLFEIVVYVLNQWIAARLQCARPV